MTPEMEQKAHRKTSETYCVFNQTRESFLSLGITRADNHLARLKGLLGRFKLRSDEGLWIVPSWGIHTIGLLFPIDLVYLDTESRVIHLVEHLGTFRIGPIRTESASVLELPTRTIYSSQTQVGDRLMIRSTEGMEAYLQEHQTKSAATASQSGRHALTGP